MNVENALWFAAPIVIAGVLVLCNTWMRGKKTNTYASLTGMLAGFFALVPTMGFESFLPSDVVAALLGGSAVAQWLISLNTDRAPS